MAKRMSLFLVSVVVALTLGFAACGEDEPTEQCQPFTAGISGDKCKDVQACCTSTACRYVVKDSNKEFPCDGTNCNKAAEDLVNYCLS